MRLIVITRDSHLTDAQKLCQFASELHDVTLVTSQLPDMSLPAAHSFNIHVIPAIGHRLGRLSRWITFCCSEISAPNDLTYVYYFPGCSLLRAVHPKKTFILDIRTAAVTAGSLKRSLRDRLLRWEASRFQQIAIIGAGLRDKLGLGRPGVSIVPVGGDRLDHSPKRFDRLHLLYVGSTSRQRRIEDTIIAFARFYREFHSRLELHYTIAGDSSDGYLAHLRQLVAGQGLTHAIDLPGYVSRDRVAAYLEQCNVGISYIPRTPFFDYQPPTKTFEYLLAGMPVIATATIENARVIHPGNGLLISDTPEAMYAALCELASGPSQYDSDQIRASVAEYSWDRIMRHTVLPLLHRTAAPSAGTRPRIEPEASNIEP